MLSDLDTREIVMRLRDQGTPWGAIVKAESETEARTMAMALITEKKKGDLDWVHAVSRTDVEIRKGPKPGGPRIAVLDYGSKENTLRELGARSSELAIFPSRVSSAEVRQWNPDGVMLTNGPGNPADVKVAVDTVRDLVGWKPIFGICMGNQILALALGAKTYKLKFGHRGSNHPVRDDLLNSVYVTSQNHGYSVDAATLPKDAKVTHVNLNDGSVAGFECADRSCFAVQYHPESHPGPHEGVRLFDYFVDRLKK
jgi:carbamoyl-phosphate synthase small subunit